MNWIRSVNFREGGSQTCWPFVILGLTLSGLVSNHTIVEDGLELLILRPPPLESWHSRSGSTPLGASQEDGLSSTSEKSEGFYSLAMFLSISSMSVYPVLFHLPLGISQLPRPGLCLLPRSCCIPCSPHLPSDSGKSSGPPRPPGLPPPLWTIVPWPCSRAH